jgi:hypothetical protein
MSMRLGGGAPGRSFADKLRDFSNEISYSKAVTPAEQDAVYRLRYQAYLNEGAINPAASGRFTDDYDAMPNCQIFGIHMGADLVSSIRFHVISREMRRGPALDVFPDLLHPMIEQGMTVVDPTRLVVDHRSSREHPQLPYLTMRIACMAAEYYGAAHCLATIRSEHQAFYKRIFGFRQMCEARPYPTLKSRIALMIGDMNEIRDRVADKYPVFTSSHAEQWLLFEQGGAAWPDRRDNRLRLTGTA